jgi:hypothetical protein
VDEVFAVVVVAAVGLARSTVFFDLRDVQASEEDEVENECAEPQLMKRRRDDFSRFIVMMLATTSTSILRVQDV